MALLSEDQMLEGLALVERAEKLKWAWGDWAGQFELRDLDKAMAELKARAREVGVC